jgi:heme exporter protein CcmD
MTEFFSMGGDGAYVWSAYGITLVVLVLNAWLARAKRRAAWKRAQQLAAHAETPRRQPKVHRLQ